MYRKKCREQLEFEDFYLPFGGKLRSDNRWVKLAALIPWDELEDRYASLFSQDQGAPAKPFRMALGALIIKERLGLTDEETVEQIRENHYLQYLIGLTEYRDEAPFDASMMVHFRKRLTDDIINEINERIVRASIDRRKNTPDDTNGTASSEEPCDDVSEAEPPNDGVLMVDASVVPADISYPTDLNLLNEARQKLEEVIDVLYEPHRGEMVKPRTYRNVARRDYLRASKKRKLSQKQLRKAIKKQLQYLKRDFRHIDHLIDRYGGLSALSRRQYRDLLVIREVYRQQEYLFRQRVHSIADRIVSISQPWIRPMVRGKTSAEVEFGAKIAVSRVGGYVLLDHCSWDAYNESTLLQEQIERYRRRFGCYPHAVLADKLYRNRDNIRFCTEHRIRLSGPRLGRPSKEGGDDTQEKRDRRMRNSIEGTFGVAKRKYGLSRIMMKRADTAETSIALIVMVMNLEKRLRDIFVNIMVRLLLSSFRSFSLCVAEF